MYEERYGKNFIPADMTIQDWGITYDELEPYYDKFEYTAAISGKAGNLKGKIVNGGNPFEAPRAREYPLAAAHADPREPRCSPQRPRTAAIIRSRDRRPTRRAPTPIPTARSSAPAQYCGYCQRFGCEANAKGSPHITVIPIAMRNPNFELRTHSWVTKVLKDYDGKRVTGVAYTNVHNGEEFEQPAGMVLLCAYAINNVHLMLLSGIGTPYDPVTQRGVIGKNYCYQTGTGARLFFEGRHFNPFMSAGGSNATIDDFNINWDFDRGKHGFVGGYNVSGGFNTALPIGYRPVPRGTPQWGKAWKAADREVVPDRHEHRRERQRHGQPLQLLRSRPDLQECVRPAADADDVRLQGRTSTSSAGTPPRSSTTIAKSMNPTRLNDATARTQPWTVVPYQSHAQYRRHHHGHQSEGSALNKYLQSWDCHNLFVVGANVFPHNASYNPTGPVGALAYWTADAIKRYVEEPGAAGAGMRCVTVHLARPAIVSAW